MNARPAPLAPPGLEPRDFAIPVLPPSMLRPLDALSMKILAALGDGPLATPNLAGRVHADRGRVAYRCQRMQDCFGLLDSHREKAATLLFFFPYTGEVVTRANYPRIKALIDRLRAADPEDPNARLLPFHPWVRVWELTAQGSALASVEARPGEAAEVVH